MLNSVQQKSDYIDNIGSMLVIASQKISPLVLDLDGDGIELTNITTTADTVYWDIDMDGFAEQSAWVAADDGLLAIDLNADGIINDHSELFGNHTGGANNYSDGFAALSAYDSNTDGYITSSDTDFTDLLVWQDVNQDGYSQSSELSSLTDLGITSINLGASLVSTTIAGNDITHESTFTMNSVTYDIVDAWSQYDDVNTEYSDGFTLDPAALFLPMLRGYGELPDLSIAMSLDNTGTGNLLSLVADIATATAGDLADNGSLADDMRALLYRWAGVVVDIRTTPMTCPL